MPEHVRGRRLMRAPRMLVALVAASAFATALVSCKTRTESPYGAEIRSSSAAPPALPLAHSAVGSGAVSKPASASAAAQVLWLPDAATPPARKRDQLSADTTPTPFRVAAIGDSLTDARAHGGGYLDALRKACPKSVVDNYGVGGNMVNQMQRRFARDVLSKRVGKEQLPYTHVIIFGGVNDLYSDISAGRTNAKIERDLRQMYGAAKDLGLRVVALTVAPWGGFKKYYTPQRGNTTRELNAWIRSQKAAGAVDAVVDAYALLSCGDPEFLCPAYAKPHKDGLHWGPAGHAVLGQELLAQAFKGCL